MTRIQSQQTQATAAIKGSKANDSQAAKVTAPSVAPTAKPTVAEKWTTVTVTASTPPFSPNRATPMDIAYDAAKLNGVAILKLDGKADKAYVRCADGTVRSAKSDAGKAALPAAGKAAN